MTVESDIQPVLAALAVFILWPFSFNFTAFPGEYEYDAGHSKLEWIIFFELHAQYLSFSRY